MDKEYLKKYFVEKLVNFRPAKWGASHTEITNLTKGLPKHTRGMKIVQSAIKELLNEELLLKAKKTGEWHVSLNPEKCKEIFELIED